MSDDPTAPFSAAGTGTSASPRSATLEGGRGASHTTSGSAKLAILALILGGIGTACTESAIVSLLPAVGQHLGMTTESTLGFAITLYMIGVVFGAPLFTVVLVHINRKMLLIAAVATQVVGNLLTVFAPNFWILLVGRFLAGVPHGAIYGLMALVGAYLAPPGKTARTVSISLLGLPIANLAIVPLITWVGQANNYRYAFGIIALFGTLAFAAMFAWLPAMKDLSSSNPKQELGLFKNRQVVLTLLAGLIGFGGLYGFLSYITRTVDTITGMNPNIMPFVMMVIGIGALVGTLLAGQLSDRVPEAAFPIIMGSFVVVLAVSPLMVQNPITLFIEVFLVGVFGTGAFSPAMQVRLIRHAGDSQNLASAMNHVSLCLANVIGSFLSTQVVHHQLGGEFMYILPAVFGAVLGAIGLVFLLSAVYLVKSGKDAAASVDSITVKGAVQ